MPFPFGKSHKSPADIVKNLKESIAVLEKQDISDKKAEKLLVPHSSPTLQSNSLTRPTSGSNISYTTYASDDMHINSRSKDPKKVAWPKAKRSSFGKQKMDRTAVLSATEEVSKNLVAMKEILYGTNEKEPQTEAVAQLAQELYNSGLLGTLVADLQLIDFEGKKDVAQIFNNILRRQIGTRTPTVEYICTQQNILFMLLKGYVQKIWFVFSCQDLLTRHKLLSAEFLENHYDKFFSEYEKLLHSENYVTKRQSLKLLGELLLDRHNFTIMTKYISKPENLKLMMNLLRDKSRNIQFEAFHVFKVFVANPNKTQPVLDILLKNQSKLIEFLSKFQNDRTEDEQFNDEKTYLVKQIRDLKRPTQQEP
ncbi:calcium-binding protein 39-like [Pyxicephalus adspersus]|uniref:calcium-binding protein 39-like n=1 Tax=Pyxicephalus adspersus TaxID=30357 RepID=UPI003B5AF4D5